MASFYEEINKKNIIADEAENAMSRATIDKWIFRLFLLLIGMMPLVVSAHVEQVVSPLISNVDVLSSGEKGELFTYYKALFVLIITISIAVLFLMKIFIMEGKIRITFLNYVLGTFVLAIIISTIASPNISIALSGQYNRSDGALSWICYLTLMFIALNIEYPKNVIRMILFTMLPFVYINFFIITMNFYGNDLLQNNAFLQNLVAITLPEGSSLSEGSQLLGTLNQWNYMSGMFAIMTVMYLTWAITTKRVDELIIGALTASVSIAIMFMSISTSGFLTLLLMSPLLAVIVLRMDIRKFGSIALLIFIVISLPMFHILADRDARVWTESFGFFTDKNPYVEDVLSSLNLGNNTVYASDQKLVLPNLTEPGVGIGSGRVYIWEKTLDLVKDRAFLGYGADSLTYNFPHYNIDARSAMWDENIIVDKPHSMYIGTLYGFGIIAFLMIIIIVVFNILTTFKCILNKSWGTVILGLTSMTYFVQSVFNDSLPSISAVSFVLLGIMLALMFNRKKGEI